MANNQNEIFDFDDDVLATDSQPVDVKDALEELEDGKSSKKEKRKEKSVEELLPDDLKKYANTDKPKRTIVNILLTSVLPAFVTLIVGLILGLLMFGGGSSNSSTNVTSAEIDNVLSLQDQVDTLKDSQLAALNATISDLTSGSSLSAGDLVTAFNAKVSDATNNSINALMETVVNEKADATAETKRLAQVSKWYAFENEADSQNSTDTLKQNVTNNLRNFVNGASLATQLGVETSKAGTPFVSVLGVTTSGTTLYNVIVPVMTSANTVYNVQYIVRLDSSNLVLAMSYEGYIAGNDNATTYYTDIANSLLSLTGQQIDDGTVSADLTQNNTSKDSASVVTKDQPKSETTSATTDSSTNSETTATTVAQ